MESEVKSSSIDAVLKLTLPDGLKVMLVDGAFVRKVIDTDFIGGGHHYAYPLWMAEDEIWLEETFNTSEQRYILMHEVAEHYLMKYLNLDYLQAHVIANGLERQFRNDADMLHEFPERMEAYNVMFYCTELRENAPKIMQAIIDYK